MLRFRNPGTQYNTQIQVIKQLYANLKNQASFTLEDMAVVIAQGKLMTAYGYAGDDALRLSNTEQESMNSALMNAKMYAEVFRMLGWVTPYSNRSYPLVFTYIGIHVATSTGDCSRLYEQCVLGINNPTEFSDRMSYNERVRFFKCALRSFIDLGGIMYKHELCLGPMSVNDMNEPEYQAMINRIKAIRGDHKRLTAAFSDLADSLGMKPTPVDNCTRLPIAFMKACNFVESINTKSLYGKSLSCLRITQHGVDVYNNICQMKDIRLDEFQSYEKNLQLSLIRLGIYSMLIRSGYDLSSVSAQIVADKQICSSIIGQQEILFSPCQTIRRELIEEALGIHLGTGASSRYSIDAFGSSVADRDALSRIETWALNISQTAASSLLIENEDIDFINKVNHLSDLGFNSRQIVEKLFDEAISFTQTRFYPLIATLFKVMGFKCHFSRPGDNGARWDAIIEDNTRSIPIEIKSPTEEEHLSIKAIRQALENKIILLSRKTYVTSPDVTTLAVGYFMPNERADVIRLIADFKAAYGYRIGVLDLKSLLSIAVSILVDGKGFDTEKLYYLEGMMNADI